MKTPPDLSSRSGPLFEPPLAANADPVTSHVAADVVVSSGRAARHREIVLALVKRWPGSTACELWSLQEGPDLLERHEISRRLADAKNAGQVMQGPARLCSRKGTMQVTWFERPVQQQFDLGGEA